MTETQKQCVIRFLHDRDVADTIKELIRETFLKPREKDVQILAARMLAVEMLDEAFNILKNVKVAQKPEVRTKQVGL